MKNLIAKPVVKNQFWIITDGKEKVGNVLANGSGFSVKLNGSSKQFKNTKSIEKQIPIEFQNIKKIRMKNELPYVEYPTTGKVYNSVLDIKRKLHLFTKTLKSKCFYSAGWFAIQQGEEKSVIFCPKYIFIQRYSYKGPFKTEDEAKNMINTQW